SSLEPGAVARQDRSRLVARTSQDRHLQGQTPARVFGHNEWKLISMSPWLPPLFCRRERNVTLSANGACDFLAGGKTELAPFQDEWRVKIWRPAPRSGCRSAETLRRL